MGGQILVNLCRFCKRKLCRLVFFLGSNGAKTVKIAHFLHFLNDFIVELHIMCQFRDQERIGIRKNRGLIRLFKCNRSVKRLYIAHYRAPMARPGLGGPDGGPGLDIYDYHQPREAMF